MFEKTEDFIDYSTKTDLTKIQPELIINTFSLTAIFSMQKDMSSFIDITDTFQLTAIEANWIEKEKYEKRFNEEVEKIKKEIGQITDKETEFTLRKEIAKKKFAIVLGRLLSKTAKEEVGVL